MEILQVLHGAICNYQLSTINYVELATNDRSWFINSPGNIRVIDRNVIAATFG